MRMMAVTVFNYCQVVNCYKHHRVVGSVPIILQSAVLLVVRQILHDSRDGDRDIPGSVADSLQCPPASASKLIMCRPIPGRHMMVWSGGILMTLLQVNFEERKCSSYFFFASWQLRSTLYYVLSTVACTKFLTQRPVTDGIKENITNKPTF